MKKSFFISEDQLTQAEGESANELSADMSRRLFIKSTGGATVGALVAHSMFIQSARAGGTIDPNAPSSQKYLVCVAAPTAVELSKAWNWTHASVNLPLLSGVIRIRELDARVIAHGPSKKEFVPCDGSMTITASLLVHCVRKEFVPDEGTTTSYASTDREAQITQQAYGIQSTGSILYLAHDAVGDALLKANDTNTSFYGEITGALGSDKGNVTARVAWTEGGVSYTIGFTLGAPGGSSFGFSVSGTKGPYTMEYQKNLPWSFAIMDKTTLVNYLNAP